MRCVNDVALLEFEKYKTHKPKLNLIFTQKKGELKY
jgi:hypothetical protein